MKNLNDFEDNVSLLSEDIPASQTLYTPAQSRRKRLSYFIPWILSFALSIGLLIALPLVRRSLKYSDDVDCLKQQEAYSPALGAAIPLHTVRFNGTLDHPSPFRGPPSPEVDAAWETLVRSKTLGAISISDSEFLKLDQKLDENTVRWSARNQGQIMASLEVFHQLHCLNLIRQYLDKDYYQTKSASFSDSPAMLRTHVGHCIEMLRQKLTCDVDVGLVTYNWVSVRGEPWPNFNTVHQCRNFDGAVEWTRKRLAHGEKLTRPKGLKGLDTPP